jgi:hypothetical protein
MPFTIHKEVKGQRWFKLKVPLHVTRDGRAVGELDPAGVRVLGQAGSLVSEEDAKKYKLDASQVESDADAYVPPPAPEPVAAPEPAPEATPEPAVQTVVEEPKKPKKAKAEE